MIWLFASQRFNGNGFREQQDAIAAAADTVATWVHSSTTQALNAMDADIDNWIAGFGASAVAALGRPASYGSIGVAHLEYPAERVLEYLSAALAIDAIDSHLLSASQRNHVEITTAVNDFLTRNSLREEGHDDLVNQYQALTVGLPPKPALANELNRAANRPTIEAAMNFLNSERGRVTALTNACGALSATLLSGRAGESAGIREALVQEVKSILLGSPDGVNSATAFLSTLKSRIAEKEADSIKIELSGDGGMKRGLEGDIQIKRASLAQEVKALSTRFRKGTAIKDFVLTWWDPYVATCEKIEVRRAVLALFDSVEDEIDLLIEVVGTIREQLAEARIELVSRETQALKRPAGGDQGGSVTYVLGDDQSIQRAFPLDDSDVLEVSTSFMAGEATGLLGRFEEMLNAKRDKSKGSSDRFNGLKFELKTALTEGLLSRARQVNRDRVNEVSVWQALEMEKASDRTLTVEQKLNRMKEVFGEIVRAASPMFPADLSRLTGRAPSQPQSSVVLVYNDEAAKAFSASSHIPAGWEQNLLGNLPVRPVDSPDPHRVSLLNRLIGFPLLAIPENEIQVATRSKALLPDPELVWSDLRARRLPLDFGEVTRAMIMENTVSSFGEDEITYAGALAVGWQLYPYGRKTDGTPNPAVIMSPSKTVFASGLKDFVNRLSTNDSYLDTLIGEVDNRLQQLAPIEWPRQVEAARTALQDEWDNTEKPAGVTKVGEAQWSGRGSDRYKALDMLLAAVRDRLDLVNQNFVRGNDKTHWVLESLRPKSPTA
jgi:hypothetical protein